MTGFARASSTIAAGSLAWELKTVNAKGLDIRVRLPNGFDGLEPECRARIAAVIGRGTCHAVLLLQRPPQPPVVRIDEAILRGLIAAIDAATPPGAGVGRVTMDGLLGIRGVVDLTEPTEDPSVRATIDRAALDVLTITLGQLQTARVAEGSGLRSVLLAQLSDIAALTTAAEDAPGRGVEAVFDRLVETVRGLIDAVPALDPNRLHQEAVMLAARADIREELDRLRIHHRAALDLITDGGIIGRKLDFLAQELGREANTLCAKSNDAALTGIGLDLRHRIEQFREQVQNLE
ncbi:YicC/YloC family endoribonuclease [Lichenihabitans psoromatis]|uniref:YicC/YloC family endoribonuclease n=1 Tax=Lichenihabitans psoromatis TaxID=2528642 RepID=UPI0010385AEB|nr:YicC/YloC family endoribonuclease [Lichenihabitans psoromatis]